VICFLKSLPLVALAGAATGVVMMLQTQISLVRFEAKSFLPVQSVSLGTCPERE